MEKKKMSNSKFRLIAIPVIAFLVVLAIVLTLVSDMFSVTLDTFLGRGKSHITQLEGMDYADKDYYGAKKSVEQSISDGYETAYEISSEGTVLLKNNGVLPVADKSTVMPFGYAYLNPVYGQADSNGSGKWVVDPFTPEDALKKSFIIDNSAVDIMNRNVAVSPGAAIGTASPGNGGSDITGSGTDSSIKEYNATDGIYDSISRRSDEIGIVFIARTGQEGSDKKYDGYDDGTKHYLDLTRNELATIKAAKAKCGKVVVVIMSSAQMEIEELAVSGGEYEADAILWVGHSGERGLDTLDGILKGDIVPSGRISDIFPTDFTSDPTYYNFGSYTYTNMTTSQYYVEYCEGIYIGYRFYETAYETAKNTDYSFVYGFLDGTGAIEERGAVLYPFGYGLSYTSFTQEIISSSANTDADEISVTVRVTNTGEYAGKEVVQLYYSAPYTDEDVQNGVEKSSVNLAAFSKTGMLKKGEYEDVTLTMKTEDFSSYDDSRRNSNGTTGCYVLEKGDYIISLRKNSHDVISVGDKMQNIVWNKSETTYFDGSDDAHIRQSDKDAQSATDVNGNIVDKPANGEYTAISNRFGYITEYMENESKNLTRANWSGSLHEIKEANSSRSKVLADKYKEMIEKANSFDYDTDKDLGNVEGSKIYSSVAPVSGKDNGLVLSSMRGVDYYDQLWDDLLDQIDFVNDESNIKSLFTKSAYGTSGIESIGLMPTTEFDGANGIKVKDLLGQGASLYDMTQSTTFGFQPLLACTWNIELAEKMGRAIADDALANGINGLYSPGLNLHRSPFCGRHFEYYSEDALLSGKMAVSFINGAEEKGMMCYVKHFGLNEQETYRSLMIHNWATEQAMRENYLRSFEIPIKEASAEIKYISEENGSVVIKTKTIRAATAVMPAQTDIGVHYGHCSYALLTEVLRKEWGFRGVTVSDYFDTTLSSRDMTLRAGCDTYLSNSANSKMRDYDSPTARLAMRNAIKHLAYAVVNSNAMQGIAPGGVVYYDMSPWRIAVIGVDAALALLVVGGVVWIILRSFDEKKTPGKYYKKGVNKK